jgi:hypothetical protein
MPYNEMSVSLEDNNLTPAVAGGSTAPVSLADFYALDLKTIYNKSISSFLVLYAMFYFNLDAMVFTGADSDLMLALKNTFVLQGVEALGASVRRQFPQLIM